MTPTSHLTVLLWMCTHQEDGSIFTSSLSIFNLYFLDFLLYQNRLYNLIFKIILKRYLFILHPDRDFPSFHLQFPLPA